MRYANSAAPSGLNFSCIFPREISPIEYLKRNEGELCSSAGAKVGLQVTGKVLGAAASAIDVVDLTLTARVESLKNKGLPDRGRIRWQSGLSLT